MKLSPSWLTLPQTQTLIKAFISASKASDIRFVGGAVRDAILAIEAEDIDIATVITPQAVSELLEKAGIRVIPTGIKHGTVTAIIDNKNFEITTLRKDVSCDGRHAEVIFTDDWQADAARRDFTMNALYLSIDGDLFDYFGGAEDARSGHVRFIGDAKIRIQEDYLRILRFFRFFTYYGKGEIDTKGLAACTELAEKISTLSGERLQHEMLKLLAIPASLTSLQLMKKSGILEHICGFSCNHLFITRNVVTNLTMLLLSAAIPPAPALNILATRWRLSNELKKQLSVLISNINNISVDISLAQQKHLLRKLGTEAFSSLIILKKALEPENNYDNMLELTNNWQPPTLPINGNDLIKLGVGESKELGEKLHKLEELWENSDYKLTKEELLSLAVRIQ